MKVKEKRVRVGRKITDDNKSNLQKILCEKDKTQQWLADETGLYKQYINSICRGRGSRNPSIENQDKIAKALKMKRHLIFV